jgi:hypothetical protein
VITATGGGLSEIDCFKYDPAVGWHPADTAFDFLMVGPSR